MMPCASTFAVESFEGHDALRWYARCVYGIQALPCFCLTLGALCLVIMLLSVHVLTTAQYSVAFIAATIVM
jgi:hypothetical protein